MKEEVKNVRNAIIVGLLLFVGLPVLLGSFKIVSPGERGVYVFLGKVSPVILDEGFHFKVPFLSSIKTLSVKIQKTDSIGEAATKDLQKVSAEVALNWTLDTTKVVEIYRTIGQRVEEVKERVIDPAVQEVLKASTAKMTAEEVLTKRLDLKDNIDKLLIERLTSYGIFVKSISIVNLNFTTEFNHAVEQKQIAEQQAQQAEYVAQKATADAKATVNAAKGDAEATLTRAKAQAASQQLLRETITDKLLQLKAIEKWDGSVPQVMGSGSNLLFNIPTKPSGVKAGKDE